MCVFKQTLGKEQLLALGKIKLNEMEIRKISVGPDYKSGAMHYIIGQDVIGGKYSIHHIKHDLKEGSIKNLPIFV